jgi:opacity protein-like surface antigen
VRIVAISAALVVLVGPAARAARAQTSDVSEERQMTLPAGRILVQAFAEISLSEEAVAEPISLAPDLWYGVSDVLTVGLVHSTRAATGLLGNAGDGLCLTGEDNGCAKVYNSVGIDARYHFYRKGSITAAADGGLFARSIDPFQLALKVGAVGRWESGSLAVELDPSIFAGLTEREPDAEDGVVVATTNKEIFFLPVTALYALNPKLGLAGQLGLQVPFESTGDTFSLGFSIGAQYMISEKLFADAAFSLPALVGGELVNDGVKLRTFTLGAGYAL